MTVKERDYFSDTLSENEILDLAGKAGMTNIFAWRSPSLKQKGVAGTDLSDNEMLKLIMEEPKLLKRPIVRIGDKLLIGGSLKAIEESLG
jgi:arsenate reductase-like glutaredoxin family protein